VRNNGVKDSVLLYLNNHLGSVQQVLDTNGNLLASYKLSPYGNMEGYKGSVQTAYHFTGKEWVDELGMYDFGARYYDPLTKQWVSRDPAREFYSPYNFVENDPLNAIDPDGRFKFNIHKGATKFGLRGLNITTKMRRTIIAASIWPDAPEGLLKMGNIFREGTLTQKSHYGELQFWHSMAFVGAKKCFRREK
jgi:RHS repeat-associated protein